MLGAGGKNFTKAAHTETVEQAVVTGGFQNSRREDCT